jgi:hypothetical protein
LSRAQAWSPRTHLSFRALTVRIDLDGRGFHDSRRSDDLIGSNAELGRHHGPACRRSSGRHRSGLAGGLVTGPQARGYRDSESPSGGARRACEARRRRGGHQTAGQRHVDRARGIGWVRIARWSSPIRQSCLNETTCNTVGGRHSRFPAARADCRAHDQWQSRRSHRRIADSSGRPSPLRARARRAGSSRSRQSRARLERRHVGIEAHPIDRFHFERPVIADDFSDAFVCHRLAGSGERGDQPRMSRVSPISRNARRSISDESAVCVRSIGSKNGSRLS